MTDLRLLEIDEDLAEGIPPGDLATARRAVTAESLRLPAGDWDARQLWASTPGLVGAILLDGLVARDVILGGRTCRQLLGSGDPILREAGGSGLLQATVSWRVLEPARLALLGHQWPRAVARWPSLSVCLLERAAEQSERLALHQAISQLPRVEDRVLSLFLLLAERWGRMTSEGPLLQLDLTHAEIGRLIGARRPTVSLALTTLTRDGTVRREDRGWMIDRSHAPSVAAAELEEPLRRRRPLVAVPSVNAVPASSSVTMLDDLRARLFEARETYDAQHEHLLAMRATLEATRQVSAGVIARSAETRLSISQRRSAP
jgi:hypothetical protein